MSFPVSTERDYVLGTHDEELARLGLQHRVWRPFALDCWYRAGITVGSRVMDVGAGPGFATADLAEVVGPSGQVIAVDRSARFVEAAGSLCERLGLSNVRLHELDLMVDPMPADGLDAVWCRWVASFVGAPRTLVELGKIRRGGYIFIAWKGDHPPRHVHVYHYGKLVVKWDLDNKKVMKGAASRRVLELITELESEGLL